MHCSVAAALPGRTLGVTLRKQKRPPPPPAGSQFRGPPPAACAQASSWPLAPHPTPSTGGSAHLGFQRLARILATGAHADCSWRGRGRPASWFCPQGEPARRGATPAMPCHPQRPCRACQTLTPCECHAGPWGQPIASLSATKRCPSWERNLDVSDSKPGSPLRLGRPLGLPWLWALREVCRALLSWGSSSQWCFQVKIIIGSVPWGPEGTRKGHTLESKIAGAASCEQG